MSVGIKHLDEFAPSRTGGNPALGIADPVKPTTFNCHGRNRTLSRKSQMLATTCMAPWRYVRPRSVSSAATATTMRRLRRRFRKEEATLPKEKEPDQDGSKQWPAQIGRLAAGTREAKVARSVIAVIIKALQQWPLYARGHWAQAHSATAQLLSDRQPGAGGTARGPRFGWRHPWSTTRLDDRDRRPCRHHSSAFGFVRLPVVSVTATFGSGTAPCTLQ